MAPKRNQPDSREAGASWATLAVKLCLIGATAQLQLACTGRAALRFNSNGLTLRSLMIPMLLLCTLAISALHGPPMGPFRAQSAAPAVQVITTRAGAFESCILHCDGFSGGLKASQTHL